MSRNIIVIGGVALGPKAASRLKRLDPTANVTMIDENINISFGGCGIPYYVSGEINSLDALRSTTYGTVRTPEYFEHKGVHTLNQTRVTAIDRAAKTLLVRNVVTGEEEKLPYDKLVLATGATPRMPPVEGHDLKNVLTLTRLEAADVIRKACEHGQVNEAVIVGGGFIGLEMAEELTNSGLEVHLFEVMPRLLPFLEERFSAAVLDVLQKHGVYVHLNAEVAALETADGYWLMDRKGKLLEKVPLSQTAGITLARGVEVAEPKPGLVIDPSENEKIQPMFDLIALLSDKDMLSDVGVIDLSKLYDIQFTYLDRFTVKLGSAEQTDRKLRFLNEVVKRLNESDRGTIDVSEVKTARFIKEE